VFCKFMMLKRVMSSMVSGLVGFVTAGCAFTRAGYESAAYTVVREEKPFEVRDYPELAVVTTATESAAGRGQDGSFMRLFRYIDGQNETGQDIAMTTPVFMRDPVGPGSTGEMMFVLPAAVATSGAPTPKAEDVRLDKLPPRRYAVVRFSGTLNQESIDDALTRLRAWIDARSGDLVVSGEPLVAGYDPPGTPPPLKRNEVLLPVMAPQVNCPEPLADSACEQ
jgi:DNA gyrase inhibitor GyrI